MLRQFNRWSIGEAARRERQRVELCFHCGDQARMPISQVMAAVAVEIHEASTRRVLYPHSLGGADSAQARRGASLTHIDPGIALDQRIFDIKRPAGWVVDRHLRSVPPYMMTVYSDVAIVSL